MSALHLDIVEMIEMGVSLEDIADKTNYPLYEIELIAYAMDQQDEAYAYDEDAE
jgi:hypothetical protein